MIECITESTPQGADIIDLVGDGALGRRLGRDRAILDKMGERDIGLSSENKPRLQLIVVSDLHAAIRAAKRIARTRRARIEQRVIPASSAVVSVAADIERGQLRSRK